MTCLMHVVGALQGARKSQGVTEVSQTAMRKWQWVSNPKVSPSSPSVLGAVVAAQEKHNKDGRNPSLNRVRTGRAEMGCA